jgi:sporulation protein YlmC with PRC-barrel domain
MESTHSGHNESAHLVGDTMVDDEGHRVGKVTDVVSRPDTLEAEWLVVKTSLFGRPRLVPLASAVEDGQIAHITYSKDDVLSAPIPEVPTSLAAHERQVLLAHYHLAN